MQPRRAVELDRVIEAVELAKTETDDARVAALLDASSTLLKAAGEPTPLGQCKEADPFAPIYLVFDSQGRRFECTHEPPHAWSP